MTLEVLLNDIRARYVGLFFEGLQRLRRGGKRVILEGAFRDEIGNLVCEGALMLPLRCDAVVEGGDQSFESIHFNSNEVLAFEPVVLKWTERVEIEVKPFLWDACCIHLVGVSPSSNWTSLTRWFNKWFDIEETNETDALGLSGVVHFISDPMADGGVSSGFRLGTRSGIRGTTRCFRGARSNKNRG